jgi:sugar transferase (PEP-CTERM/EpsH1 system associated)
MNILFLSQRVPYPPNKGDKLRSFNEIKFLSQRHNISLACLADTPEDLQYKSELKDYCQSVDIVSRPLYRTKAQAFFSLFSNVPLTLPYFYSRKLQSIVNRRLQEDIYDLIFDIPRVIDFVDVDSEKWSQYALHAKFPLRYVYRLESKRLRRYEVSIATTFHHCFFVSEKEAGDFRNLVYPGVEITAISNGVNSDMFHPSSKPYDSTSLVFTGAMDYFANVETVLYFVHHILPHIQEAVPNLTFYIVGRDPTEELQQLGKNHKNIIVTGYVDEVQPYVQQSAVFVAPMRIARGIQNKILEAMAMGVPVVTTSLGFEGITAMPGKDIFVEDQPERFAKQVIQLMKDSDSRKTVALNARKTVEENYNWDKNLEKLEAVLLEVIKRKT